MEFIFFTCVANDVDLVFGVAIGGFSLFKYFVILSLEGITIRGWLRVYKADEVREEKCGIIVRVQICS